MIFVCVFFAAEPGHATRIVSTPATVLYVGQWLKYVFFLFPGEADAKNNAWVLLINIKEIRQLARKTTF